MAAGARPRELVIYVHPESGQRIRVAHIDERGNALFVRNDVCKALGYTSPESAMRKLNDSEKGSYPLRTLGGDQQVAVVTELGLLQLILGSRKRAAQPIKQWLMRTVIPAIRRLGYALPAGSVPVLPAAFATTEEVEDIRFLAQRLCKLGPYRMHDIWSLYRRNFHLQPSRRAFAKIPRRDVQPIIDHLLSWIEQRQTASVGSAIIVKSFDRTRRPADPRIDFTPEQVSEMLADESILTSPENLSGPLGFYESLRLEPLYTESSRGNKVPYLDQTRVDTLTAFWRDSTALALCYGATLRALLPEERQAMRDGRKPIFWDVFVGRRQRRRDAYEPMTALSSLEVRTPQWPGRSSKSRPRTRRRASAA